MANKVVLFFICILLLGCQQETITSERIEDVGEKVLFNLPTASTNYYISGQKEKNGFGIVDLESGIFYFQRSNGENDSLVLPNHNSRFYNVIPCPNGQYYFLDSKNGLYLLTKVGPVFIDNINNSTILKRNSLIVSHILDVFSFASFKDENHLIIPLSWDLDQYQASGRKILKPIPRYCEYDLKSGSIRLLHCMTPNAYFNSNYGNKECDYFGCVNGDTLIVTVPYSPEITLYSISNDSIISKLNCKSSFQVESINEFLIDGMKKKSLEYERYEIETAYYGSMFYNGIRKEYYRIFYHSLPKKNAKGEYTIFEDKMSSVMVLDEHLKLKREILFSRNAYIMFGITSTKLGFIVNSYTKNVNGKLLRYEVNLAGGRFNL